VCQTLVALISVRFGLFGQGVGDPEAGGAQFSSDGHGREFQQGRDFFVVETGKQGQREDARLAGIDVLELLEDLFQGDQGFGFGPDPGEALAALDVERQFLLAAAAFFGATGSGVFDQDPPHQLTREGEELQAVGEAQIARFLQPQVNLALDKAKNSDIAFVGLGHFRKDSVLRKSDVIFSPGDLDFLDKKGAVGDISLRFFNKNGEFITGDIDERVVGLTVEEIKNIPRVVGIAGGRQKLETIHAALKTKMVDILITDDKTANELIK